MFQKCESIVDHAKPLPAAVTVVGSAATRADSKYATISRLAVGVMEAVV